MIDLNTINGFTRGQLLDYGQAVLLSRACREMDTETRDVLYAVCAGIDYLVARGKDQVKRNVKVDPIIDGIVEAIRSSLIVEITKRSVDA